MRMHLRTYSRLFIASFLFWCRSSLLSAPVLSRLAPVRDLFLFAKTFVRCCHATYCLCPPLLRYRRPRPRLPPPSAPQRRPFTHSCSYVVLALPDWMKALSPKATSLNASGRCRKG